MSIEGDQEVLSHLKASVWSTVSAILAKETEKTGVKPSSSFEAGLVQLVFDQLIDLNEDLAAFAAHAGRRTVVPADMLIAARKNSELKAMLSELNQKSESSRKEDLSPLDEE